MFNLLVENALTRAEWEEIVLERMLVLLLAATLLGCAQFLLQRIIFHVILPSLGPFLAGCQISISFTMSNLKIMSLNVKGINNVIKKVKDPNVSEKGKYKNSII